MATSTAASNIEETVILAQAGNRSLAEHHFRQVMQESSDAIDDPTVWLMMAWLAPSPQAMTQVLERFLVIEPTNELAQLGIRWARGIGNLASHSATDQSEGEEFAESNPVVESIGHISSGSLESNVTDRSSTLDSIDAVVQGVAQTYGSPSPESASSSVECEFWSDIEVAPKVETTGSTAKGSKRNNSTSSLSESGLQKTEAAKTSGHAEPTESVIGQSSQDVDLNIAESDSNGQSQVALDWGTDDTSGAMSKSGEPSQATSDLEELDSIPADWPYSSSVMPGQETQVATVAAESDSLSDVETEESEISDASASTDDSDAVFSNTLIPRENGQNGTGSKQKSLRPAILVVDDSATVRKLLTMMLTQAGYEVSTAIDGLDAVQAIAVRVPQLIITDINMPRLDGYKLCKLVTRNVRTKHIPVVMISAGIIDRLRGKLAGCSGYLVKPITPGSLNAVVEFALQGAPVH